MDDTKHRWWLSVDTVAEQMVYNRNEHRDGNAVAEGDGDDNDEDACFYS